MFSNGTRARKAEGEIFSMPAPAQTQHARPHSLLLLQKLLNLRDSASPLTLVLDNLEQSGRPVLREFLSRAKIAKSKVVYVSFATVRKPVNVDVFIKSRGKSAESLRAEIVSHYPSGAPGHAHKTLVVIDTLNSLTSSPSSSQATPLSLPLFLSSLITSPSISLVGLYHLDVPLLLSSSSCSSSACCYNEYEPDPLVTLGHLATAILRVSNLSQATARRRARDRSLQEPEWGLREGREGVLIGLKGGNGASGVAGQESSGTASKEKSRSGLVLEMELRRRSGRAVVERFVLVPPQPTPSTAVAAVAPTATTEVAAAVGNLSQLYLLSDHPEFRRPSSEEEETDAGAHAEKSGAGGGQDDEAVAAATTFSLGLTDKQRRDREGIVLPYFDAQTDIGAGEGGRILYEMGREDDFDDEEDEI